MIYIAKTNMLTIKVRECWYEMGLLSIVLLDKIAGSKGFQGVSNNFSSHHHLTSCSLENRVSNRKDAIGRHSGAVHRTRVWDTTSLVHWGVRYVPLTRYQGVLRGVRKVLSAHLQSRVLLWLPSSIVKKSTASLHTFTCHIAQAGLSVVSTESGFLWDLISSRASIMLTNLHSHQIYTPGPKTDLECHRDRMHALLAVVAPLFFPSASRDDETWWEIRHRRSYTFGIRCHCVWTTKISNSHCSASPRRTSG